MPAVGGGFLKKALNSLTFALSWVKKGAYMPLLRFLFAILRLVQRNNRRRTPQCAARGRTRVVQLQS